MKPWLSIPAQLAHDLSPLALQLYSLFNKGPTPTWNSFSWKNIEFKNRLGLAGGVDKNGDLLHVWSQLGCGFAEIGTVTPAPQKANPGKILDRSLEDQALWNQMGFPSAGADDVYFNLKRFKQAGSLSDQQSNSASGIHRGSSLNQEVASNLEKKLGTYPVFVNIGKNRITANEFAYRDYIFLLNRFYEVADAFVVNISSPNTSGLRELAKPENLNAFLQPLLETRMELRDEFKVEKPVLLKLSPDLEDDDLKQIIDTSVENQIDGFVLTNTTLGRTTKKQFPPTGGVSGLPLKDQAKKALKTASAHLGAEKTKKLLISVGGVMTAEDVFERIDLGADLVEIYTALIFQGPQFFREVAQKYNGKQEF